MDDYIKRSDALRPFVFASDGTKYLLHDCDNFPVQIHLKDVQRTLRKIPAADVVEIVRCKDCKHKPYSVDGQKTGFSVRHPDDDERCPCLCIDGWYSWIPEDDFYCANGERRTEDG